MDEITPPGYPPSTPPQRHGCLTVWLVLIIISGVFSVVATPFSTAAQTAAGMHPSIVTTLLLILSGLLSIGGALALFRWMKVGFFALVGATVLAIIANFLIGASIGIVLSGAIGIAILYGVLQIGGPNKAWTRLR